MNTPTYFASIVLDDDGRYLVRFPDVRGAVTEGETLDEAIAFAREALTGVLGSLHDDGLPVPRPTTPAAPGLYAIQPATDTAIPVALRWAREDAGLTQAQVAERLGVSQQAYQKLERTGGNPSIKTLAKVARALGRDLRVAFDVATA